MHLQQKAGASDDEDACSCIGEAKASTANECCQARSRFLSPVQTANQLRLSRKRKRGDMLFPSKHAILRNLLHEGSLVTSGLKYTLRTEAMLAAGNTIFHWSMVVEEVGDGGCCG